MKPQINFIPETPPRERQGKYDQAAHLPIFTLFIDTALIAVESEMEMKLN